MKKGVYVKDILPNAAISGIFAIAGSMLAQSRNGPYWRLTLADASGNIEAKIWHPLSNEFSEISQGALAFVQGRSSLYREQLQIAVERFSILTGEETARIDARDFLPAAPFEPEEIFAEIKSLCLDEFQHAPWRKFVISILNDREIAESFMLCPAAKNVHHAYSGGLLEHSASVFRLCLRLCDHYPALDRQTLLAGALFHDIGKIRELSGGFANDYTDEGRLMGHILLGLEIMAPFLSASSLEPPLRDHFKHLILSHHGQLDYGAVRLPQTAEAIALHYADNLDAKMNQCLNLFDRNSTDAPRWSAWQNTLDRRIFMPCQTPARANTGRQGRKDIREEQCLSLLKE